MRVQHTYHDGDVQFITLFDDGYLVACDDRRYIQCKYDEDEGYYVPDLYFVDKNNEPNWERYEMVKDQFSEEDRRWDNVIQQCFNMIMDAVVGRFVPEEE